MASLTPAKHRKLFNVLYGISKDPLAILHIPADTKPTGAAIEQAAQRARTRANAAPNMIELRAAIDKAEDLLKSHATKDQDWEKLCVWVGTRNSRLTELQSLSTTPTTNPTIISNAASNAFDLTTPPAQQAAGPAAAMMSGARGSAAGVLTTVRGVVELDSDDEDDEKTLRGSVI